MYAASDNEATSRFASSVQASGAHLQPPPKGPRPRNLTSTPSTAVAVVGTRPNPNYDGRTFTAPSPRQHVQPQAQKQSTLFEGDVDTSAITAKLNSIQVDSIGTFRSQSTPAHQFRMSAPPNLPYVPLASPAERESRIEAEPLSISLAQSQRSVSSSSLRSDRRSVDSFGMSASSSPSSAERVSPSAFVSPQPSPRSTGERSPFTAGSGAQAQRVQVVRASPALAHARQSPVQTSSPASGSPCFYQPIPIPNSRPSIQSEQDYGLLALAPENEASVDTNYVDIGHAVQQARAKQRQQQQQQQQHH
jgi:hypothetical protein